MRVIRASHLGMCFGVRDAVALAFAQADAGKLDYYRSLGIKRVVVDLPPAPAGVVLPLLDDYAKLL